jgi:hypothetical protein
MQRTEVLTAIPNISEELTASKFMVQHSDTQQAISNTAGQESKERLT